MSNSAINVLFSAETAVRLLQNSTLLLPLTLIIPKENLGTLLSFKTVTPPYRQVLEMTDSAAPLFMTISCDIFYITMNLRDNLQKK